MAKRLQFDNIEEPVKEEKKDNAAFELGTVVEIPIELIDIGENIRNVNEDDESKLRQIGESILADGQIEPCIVYQQKDRYIIKAGSRRYKACVLCDVPKLKCIIDKKFADEKERIIYQATENEHRENMNSRERESYMNRLLNLGMSQIEIAKALHKNKGWVSEALAAHNLLENNSDLNSLIKDDEMSTRDAWELSRMDETTLEAVKENVTKAGGTKEALKAEIKKEKAKKKKTEESKNESELNEDINKSFGIDDISFSIDENEDTTSEENTETENETETFDENITSFDGDFYIILDEKKKNVNIEINSVDKKLLDFIKRQIENFYIEQGYTID